MKSGDLMKLVIVGVGGYLLYNYLVQSGLWAQWFGGALATSGGSIPTSSGTGIPPGQLPSSTQLPATRPQMSVTTSSGNPSSMKVGDSYTVRITGAAPNAHVYVNATSNGNTLQDVLGPNANTDAAGNYSISGVAEAAHTGSWSETWMVGNMNLGTWNFTISSGVAGVADIVRVPNNGPINAPLPATPGLSFNSSAFKGGGYGSGYPMQRGKQGNSWVQ